MRVVRDIGTRVETERTAQLREVQQLSQTQVASQTPGLDSQQTGSMTEVTASMADLVGHETPSTVTLPGDSLLENFSSTLVAAQPAATLSTLQAKPSIPPPPRSSSVDIDALLDSNTERPTMPAPLTAARTGPATTQGTQNLLDLSDFDPLR